MIRYTHELLGTLTLLHGREESNPRWHPLVRGAAAAALHSTAPQLKRARALENVAAPRPRWASDARHFFGSGHAGGLRDARSAREVEKIRDLAATAVQVALRGHFGRQLAAEERHSVTEAARQAAEYEVLVRKGKIKPWLQAREQTHGAAARAAAARTEGVVPARASGGQQRGQQRGQQKGQQQRASEKRASAGGSPAVSAARRGSPRTA